MYLNGSPNKNVSSSSESRKGSSCNKEPQNLIRTKVSLKLNNIQSELRDDMNKSLTRLFKATKQTGLATGNSAKTLNNKLQREVTKKEHLTLHGRFTAAVKTDNQRANGRLRSQKSLVGAQADWATIKTSLKRSFSHNPTRQDKTATRTGQQANRLESLRNYRFSDTKRILKNDISCQFNRCGSWLTNLHRQSSLTTTLFILCALVPLDLLTVSCAPILSPVSINQQPVWLEGGILNTDSFGKDDFDAGTAVFFSDPSELAAGISPAFEHQTASIYGAQGGYPPQEDEQDISSERQYSPLNPSESEGRSFRDAEQLSRLQRRRLERERALEPPPWMREQPMRRGFNPALPEEKALSGDAAHQVANDGSPDGEAENADENSNDRMSAYPALGRQSRQLNGQFYEEILKHLFEGAVDNQALLDDLYDELELRAKSNNQRPVASSPLQPISGSQQQKIALNQNDAAASRDLLQETNPDSTLVVVGDEVSSGDDPGPTVTSIKGSRPALNAAYAQDMLGSYGSLQTDGSKADSNGGAADGAVSPALPKLVKEPSSGGANTSGSGRANSSSFDSGFYILPMIGPLLQRPTVDSSITSVDSVDEQQHDFSVPEAQRMPAVVSPSFHVVEDIDQTDNAQDVALAIPTTGNQDDQQQQFIERTELLSRGVGGQVDTNLRKRAAAFWTRQAQTPADGRQQRVEIEKVTDPDEAIKSYRWPTGDVSSIIELVESGYLARDQLAQLAASFRSDLEDAVGLSRATIQSFFPLSAEKLLIKLDTKKLSVNQMINMIQNYEFARGYITVSWPRDNRENPIPLVTSILRMLALNADNRSYDNSNGFERLDQKLDTAIPVKFQQQRQADNGLLGARNQPYLYELYDLLGDRAPANDLGGLFYGNDDDQSYATERPPTDSPKVIIENNRRLSLAALAAYLGALYSQPSGGPSKPARWLPNLGSAKLPVGWSSAALIPEIGGLPMAQERTKNIDNLHVADSHLMQLLILLVAFLGAFMAVKLILRFADRQLLRRRFGSISELGSLQSLWPSKASSQSSTVVGAAEKQAPLDEANFNRRRRSSPSEINGLLDGKAKIGRRIGSEKKRLEQLAQRLVNLLSLAGQGAPVKEARKPSLDALKGEKAADDEEIDELANQIVVEVENNNDNDDEEVQPGGFRSSQSYIKSLINALTRVRPTAAASAKSTDLESNRDDGEFPAMLVAAKPAEPAEEQEPGIVVSQMDISAAHLILAYMEKHLEDKERLEREWQELNAGGGSGQSSRSNSSKINQLLVQRLAKVALSEDNRQKNRNCLAVPYDRNRVKLNCLAAGAGKTGNKERKGRSNNINTGPSDYINASYIHDDDLRKPTHIIAQGPTEQTSGQFWQMVWEQGVSVIVMLTRLNENSVKMCHCYWPTCAGSNQPAVEPAVSQSGSSPPSPPLAGNGKKPPAMANAGKRQSAGQPAASKPSANNNNGQGASSSQANGRRSSVTSVFSLVGDRTSNNNQPIIANGDLGNNVLHFDISHNCSSSIDESPSEEDANKTKPSSCSTKFEVHLVSEHVSSNDYLVRNMCLINRSSGETRTITQFHYLSWPENGVPANVKSLLQFRRKVHKSYRNLKSPILVHCSDGTGRSGTYTLIDIILDRIKNGAKEIDPRATLEHLRDQRAGLCATKAQFEFVLMALAEEIQIILNALPQ